MPHPKNAPINNTPNAHTKTHTTQGELPPEWDHGLTAAGEYYYIKPNLETTWADPRVDFEDYVKEFEAAEKRGVHLRLYFRA